MQPSNRVRAAAVRMERLSIGLTGSSGIIFVRLTMEIECLQVSGGEKGQGKR